MNIHRLMAAAAGLAVLGTGAQAAILDYSDWETLFNEPVTNSATGSPQRASDVPVVMDIVTADDIRRSGATSIPQILERLPGIDVYTWSNNSYDVAIRGMNQGASGRLMLLINGRESYTDALGTVLWQFLPVQIGEIRQIEVIKGANSALYGFNAAAGVVNIITYNPQYDDPRQERVGWGSGGTLVTSVVRGAHWDGGGVRLSGGWSQWPESDYHPASPLDSTLAVRPSINRTFNIDFQNQLGEATQIRLQAGWAKDTMRSTWLSPYAFHTEVLTGQADLNSDTRIGMLGLSVAFTQYTDTQDKSTIANGSINNNVLVVKANDIFKLGSQDTIRLGTEFRHDAMNTLPLTGGVLYSTTSAGSVMWQHAFGVQLTMINAARFDNYDLSRSGITLPDTLPNSAYSRTMQEATFNSGLVYRPTQLDAFKVSVARGAQLPDLTELGGGMGQSIVPVPSSYAPFLPPFITAVEARYLGNPSLNPTILMDYQVSYERRLLALDAWARVSAYRQDIKGLHDIGPASLSFAALPVVTYMYEQVGNAHINGLELEFGGNVGLSWHWGANYALESVDSPRTPYHDFEASTPRHKVNLTFGWNQDRWEIDGYVRYVSRTQMPQQYAINQYQLYPVNDFFALMARIAFNINDRLRVEATGQTGFADNAIAGQQRQALLSLVGAF